MGWTFLALAFAPQAPAGAFPEDSLAALRRDVEAAVADGLETRELDALAARWEAARARASSPGEVASLALVAERLCDEGAPRDVETLREHALRALVGAAPSSGRARRLLGASFLPRLERMAPSEQRAAVERYDALLDALTHTTEDPAVLAALRYAPLHLRLEVARSFEAAWLDAEERERTCQALAALAAAHGALDGPGGASYAELAAREGTELREAAFGAGPSLGGRDLAGARLELAELRGNVVLLVFWSSWCLPCLDAVPEERALAEALAQEPFRIVGVCADAAAAAGCAAAARSGMTWPSLHDGPSDAGEAGVLARTLGVHAWPSAVVLDREGRLRAKFLATTFRPHWTLAEVRRVVEDLLEESER